MTLIHYRDVQSEAPFDIVGISLPFGYTVSKEVLHWVYGI